jgi:hypothetical protein
MCEIAKKPVFASVARALSHHINGAFAADMMPEALAGPAVWHGLAAKARRSVVCRIFLLK